MVFNLTYNKEGKPYEMPDDTPHVTGKTAPSEYRYSLPKQEYGMMVAEDTPAYGEKKGGNSDK